MSSLAAQFNAIEGINASVNFDNRLVLTSEAAGIDFGFELESPNDESGVLAALGINTFFTGSEAGTLGVNTQLTDGTGQVRSLPPAFPVRSTKARAMCCDLWPSTINR